MKKIGRFIFLIFLICPLSSFAQRIEERMASWRQQNPIEKLYLHFDRDNYYAGQTIWCKGYFISGFLPSGNSSVLYIELLNSRSLVILRNVFPVYGGMASGQLALPDSLPAGVYQVRAYSPLMLNYPGFTFNRSLVVYGKENKITDYSRQNSNRLLFFPEGGNFISGLSNVVAFKSTDRSGMPLPVEGDVRNSKGDRVCSIKTAHDGMGTFSIVPVHDETYYATVNGSEQKYFLPHQADEGTVFSVTDAPGRKRFKITVGGDNDLFKPAYMIGQMQHIITFKQPLQGDKKEISGIIKTDDLYSGVLQLTLFNKDSMPLAERITFIDNKEYILPATIKADTLDTGEKKRNHFTLTIPDTVTGNFSVSVTDADYESAENRPLNIYSSFLLSSDIRGYIHNPAYYFNTPGDSVKSALDLVMMTNGWTRFKWSDVIANKLPPPLYKDPGYIKISGKINIEGRRKPLAGKDVIMFISPGDSTGITKGSSRMLHTDSLGGFETDPLFFHGKMKILFSEVKGKRNEFIQVQLDGDSLTRTYPVMPDSLPFDGKTIITAAQYRMDAAYKDYITAKGITLENVIVRAIEKSPLDKLDEEYASGFFSGGVHSIRLDLRNENYAGDIYQYLRERVPGLKVSGQAGDYALHYRGGNLNYYTSNGEDSGNVTLFLNEMPSNPVALETVPLTDIALVKLFPTSTAAPGGGAALVVYTKKGKDAFIPTASATDILTYYGYTIVKEFYNPDYDRHAGNNVSDRRITLKWAPDISVIEAAALIPVTFYNNNRTKRFKIVAEGITSDGRMLMLEKIFEPGSD